MATPAEWVAGARPRTLPAAVAPVLIGTGAAIGAGVTAPGRALLALGVALALQVGSNYANDYADGVRGTDVDRVGPMRLTASGIARPSHVRLAAFIAFAVAAVFGLALTWVSGHWWFLAVGAACILGAWFYTAGKRPYGYAGLGDAAVFVFFGLVAVLGTTYSQLGRVTVPAVLGAIGVGLATCAILMVNNIRDIPGDMLAHKRTLAVRLGDARARQWFAAQLGLPLLAALIAAFWTPWALVTLVLALPAVLLSLPVLGGARGSLLIPVLGGTGMFVLAYGLLLGFGLSRG